MPQKYFPEFEEIPSLQTLSESVFETLPEDLMINKFVCFFRQTLEKISLIMVSKEYYFSLEDPYFISKFGTGYCTLSNEEYYFLLRTHISNPIFEFFFCRVNQDWDWDPEPFEIQKLTFEETHIYLNNFFKKDWRS